VEAGAGICSPRRRVSTQLGRAEELRPLGQFGVGSLHEFVGWFEGRVPLDHLPSANIAIDAATVSNRQFGIPHDVLRSAVPTDKVAVKGESRSAHRGIICALADTFERVLAGGSFRFRSGAQARGRLFPQPLGLPEASSAAGPRAVIFCARASVAFMIAVIVVPVGCLSRPRTVSCLVSPRVEREATFSSFAVLFARLACASLVFAECVAVRHLKILSVATAHAPSPPKPHSGGIASGAGSETRPKGPHQHDGTDALFAAEVQSFLRIKLRPFRVGISGLSLR
jgi:hypothetical protein